MDFNDYEDFKNLPIEQKQSIEFQIARMVELIETPGFVEDAIQRTKDYMDGKIPVHLVIEKRPIQEIQKELLQFVSDRFPSFIQEELKLDYFEFETKRQTTEFFLQVNQLLDLIGRESTPQNLSLILKKNDENIILSQVASHFFVLSKISENYLNYHFPCNAVEALRKSAYEYLESNQNPDLIWRKEDFRNPPI